MTDPLQALRDRLGAEPPASLATLDAAALADLAEIVAGARRAQAKALTDSFDGALTHVPFPLRGVLRKILT